MKKAIVIIQSENGQHKSSIIRTISQILIGLSEKTIVNLGELGLSENITSIVEIGSLKIGVASQNNLSNNTIDMIEELSGKACDVILCAIQNEQPGSTMIDKYARMNGFSVLNLKSNWSEKLEVNYLTEEQVDQIVHEINRVSEGATI